MATTVSSEILNNAPDAAKKAPAKKTTKPKAPAAKKAAAKKAPAKKAAAAEGVTTRTKQGPTGWLQDAILKVCEDFAAGKVETEGKPLTPHRIASLITSPETGENPSSGAVSACLDRWVGYKFITVIEKPKAFKAFTAAGKKKGLEQMVKDHTAALSAERKKAKAAKA